MIKAGIALSNYDEELDFLEDCRVSVDKLTVGRNTTYRSYPVAVEMAKAISAVIDKDVDEFLSQSLWISILCGEIAVFLSTSKFSVYARGIDDKLGVITYFLADADITDRTVNVITSKPKGVLASRSVSLSKAYSLDTDGCSIMIGKRNDVGVQLKKIIHTCCSFIMLVINWLHAPVRPLQCAPNCKREGHNYLVFLLFQAFQQHSSCLQSYAGCAGMSNADNQESVWC